MDSKVREGDSLVDDHSAKKKFKFKSFKKLFGIKKRKETLAPLSSSGLKQSQSASDVTIPESMRADYDSEDDIEAAVLGSRAVSHDSIFIPEIVQEAARPVRVFSQENVSDHIKALQLKLQSNIRAGPPPFGLFSKRPDDTGTSSEDDGLPHSPPEISLIHEAIKTRLSDKHRHHSSLSLGGTGSEDDDQISSETSSRPLSPEENELRDAHKGLAEKKDSASLSPSADFNTPAQFSTFLDNSAARHRLSVRPRNQRTSTSRRPSATLLEDSLDDLTTMEEEDVTTYTLEQATVTSVSAESPDKIDDLRLPSNDSVNVISTSPLNLVEDEVVSSGNIVADKSQTLPEVVQDQSPELAVATILTMQSENVTRTTNPASDGKINDQNELMGQTSRRMIVGSANITAIDKEVYPITLSANNEKRFVRENKVPSEVNDKPSIAQEIVVPISRTAPLRHSQESLVTRRRHFQSSLSEKSQHITDPPLSDKENNQLGNTEKKSEKSPTEAGAQRKFSVSSAWERPRTGSFSLKANAEGDALKNIKLSVLKPGMSKKETWKEESKTATTHTENQPTGRKKETLADPESMPTVDKAVFSNVTPFQSAVPATTDLSVVTDLQTDTEDKNPFFVKLRSTSMSLRYRDGINPTTSTVKRHSAEFKQEKAGYLPFSKDELNEAGHTEHSSKMEKSKCKIDVSEVSQSRPSVAKKPVLQNITVADNNTNKEAAECGSSQETKLKSPEANIEKKIPERRPSLHKTIEKSTPPVVTAESIKGAESKAQPAWRSMALQKQRSLREEHPIYAQKLGSQEPEKQSKDRIEVPRKQQADLIQNKTANTAVAASPDTKPTEQRQRANTLPHPAHAPQLFLMTEKEEKTPQKRQTLSVSEEPSWMELAKKKSQAWSDMPQIIK
ncbi:CRACD-like protein isoform X2 [Pseudophryne corroboree]|uniref:CRACD-like protein isoform X2 n=1 Tax=Pseudophryne corroboree TaxID=495146 RepID=UPI003081425B